MYNNVLIYLLSAKLHAEGDAGMQQNKHAKRPASVACTASRPSLFRIQRSGISPVT
jgi:hypothetical protein